MSTDLPDTQEETVRRDPPYEAICKALQPGVLIMVNASDPTSTTIDEMQVTSVDEETGQVILEGQNGTEFTIRHDDRQYRTAVKELGDAGTSRLHEPITTIEIIGTTRSM